MRLAPLLLCLATVLPAADQPPDLISAVTAAPSVRAAQARAAAAQAAVRAAGTLPDPMLGVEIGRERPEMGEDMRMAGLMVEQTLPRWGERDAMRLAARAGTAAAQAELARAAGELAAGVATALAEIAAADEQLAATRPMRERMAALAEAVRGRIASGGGTIADQLMIDSRLEQLDLQLDDQLRRRTDAEAEARGLLGLPADAPLPAFAAPSAGQLAPDLLPMLRAAHAMGLEAEAMEREALARGMPETAIGLSWQREAIGLMEESDTIALTLRVSLPWDRPAYRAGAEAARRRAAAARSEADGARLMAQAAAGRAMRAEAQARRATAVADALAARAATESEAIATRVASGTAPLDAALDLLDRVAEARMAAAMARLDQRMAQSALWRLAPPAIPDSPEGRTQP
jgi:cobalt-zinc-cadmium efflux system outer membrane protein